MVNSKDKQRRRNALSEKLSRLSSKKLAKLEQRLKGKSPERKETIPRRSGDGPVPLSFAQSRLWFLAMLDPEGSLYNLPSATRFHGFFSSLVVEGCFYQIIARHESLRTSFISEGEHPLQRVSPPRPFLLPMVDLRGVANRREELEKWLKRDAGRPFSLTEGPLVRVRAFVLEDREVVLALNMHHIVSDGWSVGVLSKEINTLYQDLLLKRPVSLPPLTIQYPDFAHWQRQWLQGEVLEKQLSYWTRILAAPLPFLALNTDRLRPAVKTHNGNSLQFKASPELSEGLRRLCRQLDTTMFNLLLAGYKTLLFRYSGQTDVIVGMPVANRNRIELEPLIGFFVNTLAIRTRFTGELGFAALVRRIKDNLLAAFNHQDVPFERIVEKIQPQRDLSRSPIFQVFFTVHNVTDERIELLGLKLEDMETDRLFAKFDMDVSLADGSDGVSGQIEFNSDLFDEATIRRMFDHYRVLLESAVAGPETALNRIGLLTPEERFLLLDTWNRSQSAFPHDQTLFSLLTKRSRAYPDAVAVSFGAVQLTYEKLINRALRLASRLRTMGVGPEVPVAVCLESSETLMVALAGILAAGGAYVPLDPVNPPARLAFMLEESRARLLLTDPAMQNKLGETSLPVLFFEDSERDRVLDQVVVDVELRPANLAYIMFTSGSTGRPKGISIRHSSVLRRVCNSCFLTFRREHVVAQTANVSFDAATIEIWGALLHGAQLSIIPKALLLAPEAFVNHLHSRYLETILLTPAVFNQIVKEIPDAFARSGQMLIGGEAAEPRWMAESLNHGGPRRLLHGYGPTENTTLASWYPVREVSPEATSLPIGRPVDNALVYLLDRALNPVPIGADGELYVGGDGLARGYWFQPAMTAEKFVPNPFPGQPGSRLYRSGDLVRHLPDGDMVFMGRIDFQLKLRGVRFEPGEVEALLSAHDQVADAVVLLRRDAPGGPRLVAYLEPSTDQEATQNELPRLLKDYLKDRVPDYMVPALFVVLAQFPLNPNGKIDRAALPAPRWDDRDEAETHVAPRTPTQEILAALQAQVLGVSRMGLTDDFFDKGGHSLLATQVLSRIRKTFGVELPLRSLFENTTVEALAARIDEATLSACGIEVSDLVAKAQPKHLPLSFAQQRLWFLDRLEPDSPFYNIPTAVEITGRPGVLALEGALHRIWVRHEILRTRFGTVGDQAVQIIDPPGPLLLPVVDLSGLSRVERERLGTELIDRDGRTGFNLSRGPLLRYYFFKLENGKSLFGLTMHHIISDGWSMGILVRELGLFYEDLLWERESDLPALALQYADFAIWQRDWLSGAVLREQREYWLEKLGGELPLLELPIDGIRPAVKTYAGDGRTLEWPADLCSSLKNLSATSGTTMFMTLLGLFKLLLARYSGQRDVIVGSPIANRNRAEVEPLIGFFVNTLALRTRIPREQGFKALLAAVRETTLGAYAHQDLPFEKLVEELQPERDPSRSPLFQVMFALQNNALPEQEMPGLRFTSPQSSGQVMAKYDLSLTIMENDEGLIGSLEFNTDLFLGRTIEEMLARLRLLAEGVVADPEGKAWLIPLFQPGERQRVLFEWNQSERQLPEQTTIHQVFEAQVDLAPQALALDDGGRFLSYDCLNRGADGLASRLREHGIRPGEPIALAMTGSAEAFVAMLAILKAGGAYVPLDPAYPEERRLWMLADSGARLMIYREIATVEAAAVEAAAVETAAVEIAAVEPVLSQGDGITRIDFGSGRRWQTYQRCVDPAFASGQSLAYIIYTSGSTGKPKGVSIAHEGVIRLVVNSGFVVLGEGERQVQGSNISFDGATMEIWTALLNGALLMVTSKDEMLDAERFARFLLRQRVTTMFTITAVFNQMARLIPEALSRLRNLPFGGEAADPKSVWNVVRQGSATRFLNLYGPTETTVLASWHWVRQVSESDAAIPIGRPIGNTTIYLLDPMGQPLPPGIPGELCIGGMGLARGYWKQPARTAEVFIPHAFSNEPGARLYRSGDLVRYRNDGIIDFVGRVDFQVKIRGFRVEPGEIEQVLKTHPAVGDALVTVRRNRTGTLYLAAYAEIGTCRVEADELQRFLQKNLPEYMIPSYLSVLEQFPINANGKVDRKALPLPETQAADGRNQEPRTPTETVLAHIFAEVLNLERVGVEQSFFELGGHSLLATRVISRIRQKLVVDLPLRKLFEAPTVAALSLLVEESRLRGAGSVAAAILPRRPGDRLQLSFAQQRLWFLDRLEPGSSFYNIPMAVAISGLPALLALEGALQRISLRHESLRTRFGSIEDQEDQAVQIIDPPRALLLPVVDLSGLERTEREAVAARSVDRDGRTGFNLNRGPLLRYYFFKLANHQSLFSLNMHHIISDGWSMGVFVRELGRFYEDLLWGRESELAPLGIQYADFSIWQRNWLSGQVLQDQLRYWREKLGGELPMLELPTDGIRPAVKTYGGDVRPLRWPAALCSGLKDLSRAAGSTLFMTLLALFKLLLARYSGQVDVIVGSPIANRNRAEIEPLIGFFVNTLALRTKIPRNEKFMSILAKVRETTLGGYAFQDLPFERLVEELQPDRDPSRSPLFQVMFALQNNSLPEQMLPGLRFTNPKNAAGVMAKYDLTLTLWELDEALAGSLEFNTDLFLGRTAEEMSARLRLLAEAVVADPDVNPWLIPLFNPEERERVLFEWNQTDRPLPEQTTIHGVFEALVDRRPDALALDDDGRFLSYACLNRGADGFAGRLRELGARLGEPIVLAMTGSSEAFVAVLAVLKAGCAYLPLDPDYPEQRRHWMLSDSGSRLMIYRGPANRGPANRGPANRGPANRGPANRGPANRGPVTEEAGDRAPSSGITQIDFGSGRRWQMRPVPAARAFASGQALAYIIYTSGSTGKPKGVGIVHEGVIRLAKNGDFLNLEPGDRQVQGSNISFDAATLEIWTTLLNGALLIVTSKDDMLDAERFAVFLQRRWVTSLFSVTAVFHHLARQIPESLSALRYLSFGGEAADPDSVRKVVKPGGPARVLNLYGPTETTVLATWFWIKEVSEKDNAIPIGKPIGNTTAYLLDRLGQPLPPGIPGELCVGGKGLARGYWQQPARTAEVFIPHAFSDEPGSRLYRSGDLVRYRGDGTIDFIGRVDFQVKIRGFRIEPGEIEQVLKSHPAVEDALVTVCRNPTGTLFLAAYAETGRCGVEQAELRRFLQQNLPDYMIPGHFFVLEQFPIEANGKIDRKALPTPDAQPETGREREPRTPTETVLAHIFAQVLNLDRVGLEQNFFELGGHSLLATRVISRIRQNLAVEIPLRQLFQAPTVVALSSLVESAHREGVVAPAIEPRDPGARLELSFAQQRLWFLDRLEPGSPFYNIPMAVKIGGRLDVSALETALNRLVARHEVLRTVFYERGEEALQRVMPPHRQEILVFDSSVLTEDLRETTANRIIDGDAATGFDLERGPLLRYFLIRHDRESWVFHLNIHHIIADGWSMDILVNELGAFYDDELHQRSEQMAPLALQYADFALWQRRWLDGEVLQTQLRYWREKLGDALEPLALPLDKPRPAVQSFNGSELSFSWPARWKTSLAALNRECGVTTFMTLLGLFKVLLARYSHQRDVVVGSPIANRNRAEIEPLIGFFVNSLALRTRVSEDLTFRELSARVRETTLDAYVHQDLPFEKLVEELQPERDPSRSPLFQVMFSMQNNSGSVQQPFPGLSFEGMGSERVTAKYDLTLTIWETERELGGSMEYNSDLFRRSSITHMLSHLRLLFEGVTADLDRPVWRLDLIDETERDRILYDWNRTGSAYPRSQSLVERFRDQVAARPDALAVRYADHLLSYDLLNRQSDGAALWLAERGARPGAAVAVFMEPGPELIIALLGILKNGGFYVPLDPAYPQRRLDHMLADSGATLLVTGTGEAPTWSGEPLANLALARGVLFDRAEPSAHKIEAQQTAYMIYTSGSTGLAKGTSIPHRAVMRLVTHTNYVSIRPGDVVAQIANISFDAATFEIWGALLNGGTILGFPKDLLLDSARFARVLKRRQLAFMFMTAALFNRVAEDEPHAFERVSNLSVGGEALNPHYVRRVLAHGPPRRLLNGYGPTESTTFATYYVMKSPADVRDNIPLGHPIANTTCYVLDRRALPQPVGIAGELCLGGDGLMSAYHRRSGLSAEKLMPHPFSDRPGQRLYRTGDLVRWNGEGLLEFLGRIDDQVKIRGFRIEPGELETVLSESEIVAEKAALVLAGPAGDMKLVAVVKVAEPWLNTHTREQWSAQLKTFTEARLPAYLRPSRWVFTDAFTYTANGKLDRKALARLAQRDETRETESAPAETDSERRVAQWYGGLLKLEKVGRHDDFFQLGGHSLLASRLISKIRSETALEVPLQELFKSPVVADFAACIDRLRETNDVYLAPVMAKADRSQPLPLSFAQQRLWFLSELQPGDVSYNMPLPNLFEGFLDAAAMEGAFGALIRRHENLRTTFADRGPAPLQIVAPYAPLRLAIIDLAGLAFPDPILQSRLAEDAGTPFDLRTGPLLRTALFRLGQQKHALLLNMHHIISDGWSLGILTTELAALYGAITKGNLSPLPPLAVQYADYAVWQRAWLQGPVLEAQLDYWRERLAGELPVLALPIDLPRPALLGNRGAGQTFEVDETLTARVRHRAQQSGTTLFMLLLPVFKLLLSRYSGQKDLIVGTPIANRDRAEIEPLIGFFVNTLALRTKLDDTLSFCGLLDQMKTEIPRAFQHGALPFEKLVEELQPQRDMSRSPIFQVMFSLENNAGADGDGLPGLTLNSIGAGTPTSKFELTMGFAEQGAVLGGSLEYNTELFVPASMALMAQRFLRLLENLLDHPDAPLRTVEPWHPEEMPRQLARWNAAAMVADTAPPLPERMEDWARRSPQHIAVFAQDRLLDVATLNGLADRLAAGLCREGVGPEVPVGLLLEPCCEMIAAQLAVLRSGGYFVPLDPKLPADRLAYMLDDAEIGLVISRHGLRHHIAASGCRFLLVDDQAPENPAPFPRQVEGTHPAYLIYTSGSTGRPKGVLITRNGLRKHVAAAADLYGLTTRDRMLQTASFSFDASLEQAWPILWVGGSLGLMGLEPWAPEDFGPRFAAQAMTHVDLTPAYLHEILLQWPADLAARLFESVSVGGEALTSHTLALWFRSPLRGVRLWNTYGPTETVITATALVITARHAVPNGPPIGSAFPFRRVYVMDALGRQLPVGIPGELCIGGPLLARAYLRRPGITAAAFLPDPWAECSGARMYRSGDRVRWNSEGDLEFLGRLDHQVKIRGFRIETGEIEAVLAQHAAIDQALVLAVKHADGGPFLAALLVTGILKPQQKSLIAALSTHAAEKLPVYMIPDQWVFLESFPLTQNGKIDRRVLEKQVLEERETGSRQAGTEAPLGQVEQQVAAIFETVLGPAVKGLVGRRAHFFELGGHSLLATRVISRVRGAFGLEIPLQSLFEAPVVADFAQRIGTFARTADGDAVPPLVAVDRDRPLPLSFAQQRLWFLDKLQPGSDIYNMPMAARLKGNLDVASLERCFDLLTARHESLRTRFSEAAGTPSQVILPFEPIALALIDFSRMEPTRGDALALDLKTRHAHMVFDLERGGLFRFALLRIAPCRHDFMMNMHHIISDGWSMDLFMGELTDLYRACLRGEAASLPPLVLQYADFAVWQRSWLRGDTLAAQLGFWRQTLSGAPPSLDLPTDRPYPAVSDSRGGVHHFALDQDLLSGLRQLCRQGECTLFMVLLAAFKVLLSRYSGQEDVVVGTPIANRNQTETEAIVGFFVNTLALRTDLRQDPSFEQVLARVRSRTLAAFQHQDLPFEKLVEALQPERNMSRTPLFQVMFVLQNIGGGEGSPWPGLEMEGTGVAQVNAKFELTLTLAEAELGLVGAFEYKLEIFDHAFITAMAVHWEILLRGLLKDPTQKIASLPLLPDSERETLLVTWNDTASPYPKERGLAALFEDWARRTPDRPALCYAARALSYACLNQRAEHLAAHLRREGVTTEVPVGLFMAPCPELIIAVLAIIKAGGAYVPLETDYPENRLAHMIADSGANPILVDHRLRNRLPQRGCRLLNFHDFDLQAGRPDSNPSLFLGPDQWACMFYTSGSTGLPKGSVILQGSLIRLVFGTPNISWREEQYYSQLCNISFDAASQEIWGPLLRGAVVVGIDKTVMLDTDRFVEELQKRPLGGMFLTTALFHRLAETVPAAFARVETLMVGGEALQTQPVRRLFAALPPGRLINGYGPTENTTFSAAFVVDAQPENTVPIGTPYSNSTCVVLSAAGRLQPIGVAGELCLGGDGLMRGYFQRPALNAEKLIPDAFLGTAGGRLYRSGDLVRWRRDGKLEYLGRLDHQLKIRGFRIECGEIQAVLERGEAVLEAVVQPTQNRFGDLGLAAFVRVASGGPSTDSDRLRVRCEAALPAYMVPARFLILETFPLTANGKLDRGALIQKLTETVEVSDVSGPCFPDAELDAIEGQIAQIWSELLGLPSFDLTRDFFSLGGHSLLAVRLMEHLKTRFQVDLPLAALFRADTVAAQAQWLRERGGKESDGPLIAVNESGGKAPLYLVHPGGGDILCYAALGREWDSQRPLFAFQAPGLHDRHEPVSNLRDLAGLYVEALLKKQVAEPIHLGGWSLGGVIALEMARQLGERGRKVGRVILIDSWPAPTDVVSSIPDDRQCAQFFARDMEQLAGTALDLEEEVSAALGSEEAVAFILGKIQELLQLPGPSGMARVRAMFGVFLANLKALTGHVPQPYGERPILIQSREDNPEAERQRSAWSALIPEGIQHLSAAGNHYSMLQPPHIKQLAVTMDNLLEGPVE